MCKLKFDIIMGLANNQLRATGQEGEIEIARQLASTRYSICRRMRV